MIDATARKIADDKISAWEIEKHDCLRRARNLQARIRRLRKKLRDLDDGIEQLTMPGVSEET